MTSIKNIITLNKKCLWKNTTLAQTIFDLKENFNFDPEIRFC